LEGGLKVLQDVAPVGLVPSSTPVTLIYDNEIKEIAGVFAVEAGAALIAGDGLVG
jgi:hypothetical protein